MTSGPPPGPAAAAPTLEARIGRLEAESALRQLAVRYALAVDGRDLETLTGLFCADVDAGSWGTGRTALGAFYDDVLRRFGRTIHTVANHVIDLEHDATTASGVVYCRAEHELDGEWVVQALCYFDDYVREDDGRWRFRRRKLESFYVNDVLARPGDPSYLQHPQLARHTRLPERFPTWGPFWAAVADR